MTKRAVSKKVSKYGRLKTPRTQKRIPKYDLRHSRTGSAPFVDSLCKTETNVRGKIINGRANGQSYEFTSF